MKIFLMLKKFKNDECGAVTVDWVVLTAAIVGLGLVVMNTVGGGVQTLAGKVKTDVSARNSGYTTQATP
ncbi:MAG: pilus assembly protein [Microgenomates group bacterium]